MLNSEMMTLNLTREDVCDLLRATTRLVIDFRREAEAAETAGDLNAQRRGANNAEFWKGVHDRVQAQLEEFDKQHGF